MDCTSREAFFLRDHAAIRNVTGNSVCSLILSAVEIDMPWNSSQVEAYGESFQAWTSEELGKAIELVKDACPWNKLIFVVLCF